MKKKLKETRGQRMVHNGIRRKMDVKKAESRRRRGNMKKGNRKRKREGIGGGSKDEE